MGVTAQSSPTMNGLLVLSTLAAASAQVVLPYGGLAGYPYGYAGYPYAVAKPVVNEVEVPVPVVYAHRHRLQELLRSRRALLPGGRGAQEEVCRRGSCRGCPRCCHRPSLRTWTRIPRSWLRWSRLCRSPLPLCRRRPCPC